MTYNEALQIINDYIVANGNNEITADVLRPILEAMVEASRDTTGLLQNLETEANENLVAAINELKAMIPEGATGTPVNFHFGEANPNTTPPASFKPGDNYWQSVGGNPVQLWIYNGFSWVEFGSGGGGIPEAPVDGKAYGRKDEDWTEVTNTPMKTAKVHYSALGAASLEEVTPEMCDAWIEANVSAGDRLGFVLEVDDASIYNFDVTADWAGGGITDEASFIYKLNSYGGVYTVTDFNIEGTRLRANLSITGEDQQLILFTMGITGIGKIDIPNVTWYELHGNNLTSVAADAWPTAPKTLFLNDNALDEASINALLVRLDNDIIDGTARFITLQDGTNATPTGAGAAARTSLIGKGAFVSINS